MLSVAKTELLGWSAAVKQESFPDPQIRQLFARILGEGLRSDIQSSHYELKNRCFYTTPHGGELESSASARIGDRGGAICLNPEAILAAGATDADVYALLLHEHAHHLGYQEQEAEAIGNALGDYVAAYFYSRLPSSRLI